jgi:hypothetical protein
MGVSYYANLAYGYPTYAGSEHDAGLAGLIYEVIETGADWPLEFKGVMEPSEQALAAARAGFDFTHMDTFDETRAMVAIKEASFSVGAYYDDPKPLEAAQLVVQAEWRERFDKLAVLFGDKFEEPPQWYLGVNIS